MSSQEYKRKFIENNISTVEHRIIMENFLGRKLTDSEVVHHINGNRRDNRIENLYLCANKAEHNKLHAGDCCPKGHEFTEENTQIKSHILKNGEIGFSRRCRECHNAEERNRTLEKKKEG